MTAPNRARGARRGALVIAAGLALLASACSSSGEPDRSATGSTTTATGATTTGAADDPADRACDQGASTDQVASTPVPGVASDHSVTSFDGTVIRAHWFPLDGASAAAPAPTVLMGPGWSMAGDTSLDGGGIFAALSISGLHDAGYNVLTWDPRGFGKSTGTVQIDHAATEGRDVQILLDWVARRPEAQTDREGDPRAGMVGFSYGGGIQLVVASIDCRVDALVPGIAWHSLGTSLYKNETMKQGWASLLRTAASGADLDPHIQSASDEGLATGVLSDGNVRWFLDRGPGDAVDRIAVPTLFLQGTVDTLFTLDEAVTNYRALRENHVPTAMLWFCGGHGACLTEEGDATRASDASFAWLDRYVKGEKGVDTGPRFSFVDQDGTTWTADDYPEKTDQTVTAEGTGSLRLGGDGGAGPAEIPASSTGTLDRFVAAITPGRAKKAVEVPIEIGDVEGVALGAPKLTLSYSGSGPDETRPPRVFAQLVDEERGVVVGNQITPVPLVLDGRRHTAEVDLEVIAQKVAAGQTLTLQITASTVAYAAGRSAGQVTFDSIEIRLPVETKRLTRA